MKFFSIFNEIETTPTKVETVPKNHVGTAAAAMKLIRSVLSCTLDCDTGMVHDTIICQSHLNNLITFNAVLIRWLRNETEGDAFRSASQVQDWAKGIQNFAVALLHYKKTTTLLKCRLPVYNWQRYFPMLRLSLLLWSRRWNCLNLTNNWNCLVDMELQNNTTPATMLIITQRLCFIIKGNYSMTIYRYPILFF